MCSVSIFVEMYSAKVCIATQSLIEASSSACLVYPTVVTTEGLFRVPGSKLRVTRLAEELTDSDWTSILSDSSYKPHDFASVLKQYLIDLPESLLPGNHLEAYLQVAGVLVYSVHRQSLVYSVHRQSLVYSVHR